jgi:catechol 2,3-dioxygenase-like lactoylglutathione lyase family enzyme
MSVMITARDMRKTVSFYCDKLGFELKESWPSAEDPQWANLVLNGQSVMAGSLPDPEQFGKDCQADPATIAHWRRVAEDLETNRPGIGVQIYVQVEDIDGYAAEIARRGLELQTEPVTHFYGVRELGLDDPDGYRLVFHTPVAMVTCQSCGMPLSDAVPGQMYCSYCTDEKGELRSYEQVFEGTVAGYFMSMRKMERREAEVAAREHLAKMPAWAGR